MIYKYSLVQLWPMEEDPSQSAVVVWDSANRSQPHAPIKDFTILLTEANAAIEAYGKVEKDFRSPQSKNRISSAIQSDRDEYYADKNRLAELELAMEQCVYEVEHAPNRPNGGAPRRGESPWSGAREQGFYPMPQQKPTFGQPFGQPSPQPTFGQPTFGQPFGRPSPQPTFGQPTFGQPFGQPSPQPTFGQPQLTPFGQPQSPFQSPQVNPHKVAREAQTSYYLPKIMNALKLTKSEFSMFNPPWFTIKKHSAKPMYGSGHFYLEATPENKRTIVGVFWRVLMDSIEPDYNLVEVVRVMVYMEGRHDRQDINNLDDVDRGIINTVLSEALSITHFGQTLELEQMRKQLDEQVVANTKLLSQLQQLGQIGDPTSVNVGLALSEQQQQFDKTLREQKAQLKEQHELALHDNTEKLERVIHEQRVRLEQQQQQLAIKTPMHSTELVPISSSAMPNEVALLQQQVKSLRALLSTKEESMQALLAAKDEALAANKETISVAKTAMMQTSAALGQQQAITAELAVTASKQAAALNHGLAIVSASADNSKMLMQANDWSPD